MAIAVERSAVRVFSHRLAMRVASFCEVRHGVALVTVTRSSMNPTEPSSFMASSETSSRRTSPPASRIVSDRNGRVAIRLTKIV